ncbi:unnamed protein product [Lymnaea stagnalis]|uniref:Ribonuclease P protein subunit p20 n=1 Tax=Lymnaea stagnalis TaxID=6523 RepID=A0AAV2HK75_LYMST
MQASSSKLDTEEYTLRKRLPHRYPQRHNDVYISAKTNFKAQESKCLKLLDAGNEVVIHGLGRAVNRAINLALQLKSKGVGTVNLAVQTSTVDLIDDLVPETDDGEPKTVFRSNSAVHIRIYRPVENTEPSEKETRSAGKEKL